MRSLASNARRSARRSALGAAALVPLLSLVGCEEGGSSAPAASAPPSSVSVETAVAPSVAAPSSVDGVVRSTDPEAVAGWARHTETAPELRLAALRHLEGLSPGLAVEVAAALARDPDPLLRTNAIAALTRAESPAAAAALEGLDPEARALADALRTPGSRSEGGQPQ